MSSRTGHLDLYLCLNGENATMSDICNFGETKLIMCQWSWKWANVVENVLMMSEKLKWANEVNNGKMKLIYAWLTTGS